MGGSSSFCRLVGWFWVGRRDGDRSWKFEFGFSGEKSGAYYDYFYGCERFCCPISPRTRGARSDSFGDVGI